MSLISAAVILLVSSILTLLVASPILYLLRRRRMRRGGDQASLISQPLTFIQALPGLLIVIALFFAYSAEYIAPQSWLGQRVTTFEGRFWLFIFVWLTLLAIERIVRSIWRGHQARRGSE